MQKTRTRVISALLVFMMLLTLMPTVAFAAAGDVAQIGDTTYATLDEAVDAAADGATIELLGDATTNGLNLSKNLTIQAAEGVADPTITFTQYGIALWGKALTFKDVNVVMNGIGSTPYTGEWSWMTICASENAFLTLDNVDMTMDATGTTNSPHAIYFCNNNVLNVINGSNLTIKNYANDALEWDGGNGGYNVNITDSTFTSDHNRSGFTGTFYATITDSKVNVINSTGNGSNGSHFIIKTTEEALETETKDDDTVVNFNNNGSHGLSAGELQIINSEVNANNNHGMGITVNNNFKVENSVVTVTGNADNSSYGYAAVRLYNDFDFSVDSTSKLYINDNNNTGLYVCQGNLTVADGAVLEITGNHVTHDLLDGYGGGIYVGYGDNYDPTVVLPADAKIYNNHAITGGDDIYVSDGVNGPSLTFGEVGEGWALDGDPDCTHDIDGWYDDSENARWEAHAANAADNHIIEFTGFTDGAATVTGLTALKAAHGVLPLDSEWETSKSKTATNLDDNYESDVTLSLPAADYERTIDVVFVIDDTHAGSGIFEEAVNGLLDDLAEKGYLDINVGIVAFDAVARDWLAVTSENAYVGLVSLKDANALAALKTAIGTQLAYTNNGEANPDGDYTEKVGATNTEWPLELAQEILKTGNGSEQHVIMFSDMYGYVYRGDLTIDGITYENVPLSKRLGNYKLGQLCISDPKYNNWTDVYANREEANDTTYDSFFRDSSWDVYWNIYTNVATNPNINNAPQNSVPQYVDGVTFYYFTPFEKSSCLTYDRIQALLDVGIQVTIVNNDFDPGSSVIQGIKNEMLDDLADQGVTLIREQAASGETFNSTEMGKVSAALQNKLIQVVDAGSYVVDEIGSGTDDAGIEYNFDFIDDIDNLTLTVGDEELAKEELTDINFDHPGAASGYGFKKAGSDVYDFELYYYPTGRDGQSNECFVWEINVPVTKDQTVQLTYTVKLTDPQTASGTYGEYDEDGEETTSTGLYTNNSATLYPVDSNGYKHVPEAFAKPTVSYTVGGSSSGGGGGNPSEPSIRPDEPDDLNTEDHYAYIIGYPIDYRTGEPTDDKSVWPVQPQGNITRAEVATIFFRMLTDDARAEYWSQTNDYNDVEPDDWFNNAVSTLTNMGIISGDPDGAFRPNDPITRAELTKVAVGFFDVTGDYEDGTFSDVDADSWYADFIDAAFDLGLVEGYPDGTIRPQAYITRAEAATMVNRTLGRAPDTDHLLPEDEMRVWPDNSDADAWYYAQIQEATNSHDYEWITSGGEEIENWTHKLNDRIWEQLEREWSDAYSAPGGEVVD